MVSVTEGPYTSLVRLTFHKLSFEDVRQYLFNNMDANRKLKMKVEAIYFYACVFSYHEMNEIRVLVNPLKIKYVRFIECEVNYGTDDYEVIVAMHETMRKAFTATGHAFQDHGV